MTSTDPSRQSRTDDSPPQSRPARTRRRFLRLSSAVALAGATGCLDGLGGTASPEEQAMAQREALSTYADVENAMADGYLLSVPYVRGDAGNLGFPFVNFDAPELEPEQPNVLFYDLGDDGAYALAGVEWFVPADTTDEPPSLFGRTLDGPTPGETSFIPEHYGLHAWLFEENPEGLFAPVHPGLQPPSFIGQLETLWETFEPYYLAPDRALDEGYRNTETCVTTEAGGYGVPFVDPERTGTTLAEPAVLLYRLSSTWNYQLMGAEWYVPADEASSPTMLGQPFHEPVESHGPKLDQGRHVGLHAWFFAANPAGVFAPFNPAVTC